MRTLAFYEFVGVVKLVGGQQRTPLFPFGGKVHRNAKRMIETFQDTFKVVIWCNYVNSGYI